MTSRKPDLIETVLVKHFFNAMIFRTACESGSLGRAAARIGISQPAATRGLGRLETALGCELLERSAAGARPTEFGRVILGHLDQAATALGAAARNLGEIRRRHQNALICGAPAVNMAVLTAAAEKFMDLYPAFSLRLVEDTTSQLVEGLTMSELDVVIGSRIGDATYDSIEIVPLLEERLGVFVLPSSPFATNAPASLAQMVDSARWILPERDNALRSLFERELAERGLPLPSRFIESHSPSVVRQLVRNGDYAALSTSLVHLDQLQSGTVVQLALDWQIPTASHVLYHRERDKMSRQAMAFAEMVKLQTQRMQ